MTQRKPLSRPPRGLRPLGRVQSGSPDAPFSTHWSKLWPSRQMFFPTSLQSNSGAESRQSPHGWYSPITSQLATHSLTFPHASKIPIAERPSFVRPVPSNAPTGDVSSNPSRQSSSAQFPRRGSNLSPHGNRRFAPVNGSYDAAYSHCASVGSVLPTHSQYARAPSFDMYVAGCRSSPGGTRNVAVELVALPSGGVSTWNRIFGATLCLGHAAGTVTSQPRARASGLARNFANCSIVTSYWSTKNGDSVTSCAGVAFGHDSPSGGPRRNVPPGAKHIGFGSRSGRGAYEVEQSGPSYGSPGAPTGIGPGAMSTSRAPASRAAASWPTTRAPASAWARARSFELHAAFARTATTIHFTPLISGELLGHRKGAGP